ncbi:hypothetical protein RHSIM_RhsimUnG0185600 [Rhododendron simsii]|uniref:SWIRM domain-containing protein n=1 Tax=Rhododendron simsii TaxID=118357 RepID=A0A834FWH8_RHOSS|nr:hypothetical protein RHSIM_RhsimUnG0185600 [Rhododendron simsii]
MAAISAAVAAFSSSLASLHLSRPSSLSRTRCHLRTITSSLSSSTEFNITFAPKPPSPKPEELSPSITDDLGRQLFIPWIVRDDNGNLTLTTTPPPRLLHEMANATTQKKKAKEKKTTKKKESPSNKEVAEAASEKPPPPKYSKAARRFYNENFREPQQQRLSKVLASSGVRKVLLSVASRRSSEELIFGGRVTVNGSVCNTPQTRVDPARDVIYVNGNRLPKRLPPKVYLALNKPKGYICSSGEKETKSVISLFDDYLKSWDKRNPGQSKPRLFTVGRLDVSTSGLIIVTNDGEFAQKLSHPSSNFSKEYIATVNGKVNQRHLIAISEGTVIDGTHCTPDAVELLPQQPDISRPRLRIVVHEGRNHEVRELVKNAGLEIVFELASSVILHPDSCTKAYTYKWFQASIRPWVYHMPYASNGIFGVSNGELSMPSSSASAIIPNIGVSNSSNANYKNPNPSTQTVPDVSDEIIVINKEATSEALTALTSGFPADSLTEEEIDARVVSVVGGIEQVNYILVRNHIIMRWRENVSHWITKEMFVDVIPSHCSKLLDSAYEYLVSHGYINFGVAPAIKEKIPSEPSKPTVIIVGAGLAGLAAARQLMRFGFKVTVLEGRKRAGGRVYTMKMEGGNRTASADLGGSVLTGTLGNPLGILARQLSSSLHKVRDKCPLYNLDGKPVDPDVDSKVETAFNHLLDKASKIRQLMGDVSQDVSLGSALETFWQVYGDAAKAEEMNLFNWHLANLEYANAGLLSKLSLAFWDQDDPYDMGGDHCFLPGGNGRLIQALAENMPIVYEKTVHTIRYTSDGVQVVAGSQVFEGDMVLCTVPLGVLKSGSIKFFPELPQRKLDGIKRLGFGLLNKVSMLFPHVFWGTDLDTFGHLTDDPSRRGEFFLFYSYATVAGGPLLIALVAGEAAHKFESTPPTDAVTRVLQILKGIYEPQGIDVPEPIQTVCTRWGSDPFSLGSYSNVAVGASGDDYDILAESVGDGRVFFAGEATMRRYPATMHGAFLSGLREAANMARSTGLRSMKTKVDRSPSKNAHSCASLLADLFREPDMEFGGFSVIFGRKNSDPKSTAVLRVTLSGQRKRNQEGSKPDQPHSNKLLFQQLQSHFNQQQEFHVYALLSREQALELREVRGGDDMRLNHLCEKLGVKLVGRKGLGPTADSVIASIKAERGNRKSASTSMSLKSGTSKPRAILKKKFVRKAKVMRINNGSTPPNVGVGAKMTVVMVYLHSLIHLCVEMRPHAFRHQLLGQHYGWKCPSIFEQEFDGGSCCPLTWQTTFCLNSSLGSVIYKLAAGGISTLRWKVDILLIDGILDAYPLLPKNAASGRFGVMITVFFN